MHLLGIQAGFIYLFIFIQKFQQITANISSSVSDEIIHNYFFSYRLPFFLQTFLQLLRKCLILIDTGVFCLEKMSLETCTCRYNVWMKLFFPLTHNDWFYDICKLHSLSPIFVFISGYCYPKCTNYLNLFDH